MDKDLMDQEEIDKLFEELSKEQPEVGELEAQTPQPKGTEILSQEEIDALLRGLEEGQIPIEEAEVPLEESVEVRPFDFRQWELLELERIERLKLVLERFSKAAGSALSEYLHRPVDVDLSERKAMYFEEFIKKVPVPTGLIILRVSPEENYALLVLDARTVFYAIDVLFGGGRPGRAKVEGREFTSIEMRVIRNLSAILLESLGEAFQLMCEVKFFPEKVELSPEFAVLFFKKEAVLVASFDLDFGGALGTMTLCLPSSLLKALRDRAMGRAEVTVEVEDPKWKEALREALSEVLVRVEVEFLRKKFTLRELLGLKEGDLIFFGPKAEEEVIGRVQGVPLFKGKPGLSRGYRAVKITEILS